MQAEGTYDAHHPGGALVAASRRPELLALTSIRFFAALEVVLLHTLFELGGDRARALPVIIVQLLTRGDLAVSFFFVLSGFILAYTYCDHDNDLKTTAAAFWSARFARIYPVYFLGFLMDAPRVIAFFIHSADSLAGAWLKIGVAGLAYLSLLQAWHPRLTNTWNTPGWTLSVEAFFYAGFPRLLHGTKSWRPRRLAFVALAIWAVPILAQALVFQLRSADVTNATSLTFWRSFPLLRLPEFALGVAAGRLFLAPRGDQFENALRRWGTLAAALILALAICVRFLPASMPNATLGAPLFAVAILTLATGGLPAQRWLTSPTLVLLGRASYAVYILHQPFKLLFLMLAQVLGVDSPSPALLIAYLISLQVFCVGLFVWYEDPLRRSITRLRTC